MCSSFYTYFTQQLLLNRDLSTPCSCTWVLCYVLRCFSRFLELHRTLQPATRVAPEKQEFSLKIFYFSINAYFLFIHIYISIYILQKKNILNISPWMLVGHDFKPVWTQTQTPTLRLRMSLSSRHMSLFFTGLHVWVSHKSSSSFGSLGGFCNNFNCPLNSPIFR